jgi:hypothetical protein
MRIPRSCAALASLAVLACAPPPARVAPARGAEVALNHVYLYVDSATVRAIMNSAFMRDSFSDLRVETNSDAGGRTWNAVYLHGEQTYFELFGPRESSFPPGFTGIALSVERPGALEGVAARLASVTGMPLYREPTRTVRGADTIPWFKQVSVVYPGYPDSLAEVYSWVIENEPAFFREVIRDTAASDDDISRRRYLVKRYRPDRLLRDITGITIALSPRRGARLLTELEAHGWTVVRSAPGGTSGRATGPGAEIAVVPVSATRPFGLRELRMSLTRPVAAVRSIQLGPRSRLIMLTNGMARWVFD